LRPTFTREDIRRALRQNFADRLRTLFLRVLRRTGEEAVAFARELNTYTDQTGNLRSSIGYAIYFDGQLIERNFEQVASGSEGVGEGERHAAAQVPSIGFALIVVAGMDYAMAVQARGLDVLDGAEIEAEKIFERQLRNLKAQIAAWSGRGVA